MTWFLFAALISAPAGEAMTATLVEGMVTADGAAEPPRPFDAESEKGHRFMEWVRSRRTREGEQPGRIRREMRSPEQEHRIRERIRDRRRER